jgi:A/G-specific adenine glycosylase
MKRRDIERIRKRLADWYERHRRRLPWRDTDDPYRIWVSEVMLQQTRVQTVIPYYLAFTERFPSVPALAAADREAVLSAWEGLGYYSRARNLHRAAAVLAEGHGGRVPDSPEAFRKLPGVGPYIAAAVTSIAFGAPAAVVDGNVKRVLARILALEHPVNRPDAHPVFQAEADRLLDRGAPGRHNQAVMELGALVCRPRSPLCTDCPVHAHCRALARGRTDVLPRRVHRKPAPHVRTVTAVIRRNGRLLAVRRPETGLLGGMWEFPAGEPAPGESGGEACRRIAREAVGLEVAVTGRIGRVRHAYTHFSVTTEVWSCTARPGRVERSPAGAFRWISLDATEDMPFPRLQRKIMERLGRRAGPAD